MMASRRCRRAIGPADQTPAPSGPREPMESTMRPTAATSGRRPSLRTSPAIPHIPGFLPRTVEISPLWAEMHAGGRRWSAGRGEHVQITFGVEEEYFLVDAATGALVGGSARVLAAARERLGKAVTT